MTKKQQINIIFPDQKVKQFKNGVTGFDIAKSISSSLLKKAVAIEVNGKKFDLSQKITDDAQIAIITNDSKEGLEILRHDAAHIMAQAVKELWPDTQVTIGPAIEDGFYYDFATKKPFSENDFAKIEERMRLVSNKKYPITREVWQKDAAIEFFNKNGEKYKVKIIKDLPEDEEITLYRQGSFIDLCRGPHCPDTGYIKYFKLMKTSAAYWRGDSSNESLSRIYGTAWHSKEALEAYLNLIEEAKKRDHKKLGYEMDLFHLQEEAPGAVFWHSKGWLLYRTLQEYIRKKCNNNGYLEVKTPQLLDKTLWEKSGHWEKFRENMFITKSEGDERIMALKPMNCPAHVQIFNQGITSYKDLPMRLAEFGRCHRNESSGSLYGIMRVRDFTQDDAHIFCTEDQITSETSKFCDLLLEVYRDLGFEEVAVKFADRPEKRVGSDAIWDKAETSLKNAVKEIGIEYQINSGEGAFYGPKLEFHLKDALGRSWQCGTLQVDFSLPHRLNATYVDSNSNKQHPVMLHRAILGTFERFIGILIEHYAGKFPLWLAPIQVVIFPVSNKFNDYALKVYNICKDFGVRCEVDLSAEKTGYKIRHYSLQKIPYLIVVGEREMQNDTVTIRKLGEQNQETINIDEFLKIIQSAIKIPE